MLLLSLNFGIPFFDRKAANFMMPLIAKPGEEGGLGLTNLQIGLLSSGLSLTWALSGMAVGPLSDKLGSRKPIVVIATFAFCACSMLSGLAGSFLLLLGARLLMGIAEGGVMPVSHAMIASEVEPKHRGLAMGVGQNLGSNLLGSTAAPLILVPIATYFGWSLNGIFPLFMATVPAERVDPRLTASLTGVVLGLGEVIGGVGSPFLAGALADMYDLTAPMWLLVVLTLVALVASMFLRDSSPALSSPR